MTMRNPVRYIRLLAIAIPVCLAGCVKLARESPRLKLFALGGAEVVATPTVGATTAVRRPLAVGMRRLILASYLAVPAVMMRRGANQLEASEFHRWGGDLEESINRAVGTYLAGLPPVRAVDVAPWPSRARHNFLVQLEISRFEGVADSAATVGRVHLMAEWGIIRPLDGAVMVRGRTDDRVGTFRVGDYAGLVTGLDAALVHVARDIGACLATFPNDSTPPARCGSAPDGVGSGAR